MDTKTWILTAVILVAAQAAAAQEPPFAIDDIPEIDGTVEDWDPATGHISVDGFEGQVKRGARATRIRDIQGHDLDYGAIREGRTAAIRFDPDEDSIDLLVLLPPALRSD